MHPRGSADETMQFTPLGAGSEVGRSCHILKFKGKTIMLDAGIHPALSGLASLPYFDEIDPAEIDILLVTHFHIDHAASVPYLMEKTSFKGRVFMTHPTKAILKWMLSDYTRVSNASADDQLYDEQDLIRAYDRIEAVDFHQVVEVEGVRFTAYNAGHVLGAAMFLIEIAGVKLLYTGDYSREEDRHLMAAEKPDDQADVLVCESTYGVQNHAPRTEREARFTTLVHETVQRGGRCLIPLFALGRAQEVLLILDEYWQLHPELHSIPIYYASSMARKCMAVYQTYINMMNSHIRQQFQTSNPFVFKHISNLRSVEHFDDVGPCVMLASPGMLQSGLSRQLLEMWCTDRKNGVIIPGYVVDNTPAKTLLNEPSEIVAMSGAKLPRRCTVDYISFSAHVDFAQNKEFIEDVNAQHLILVHGETNMMFRLKQALTVDWAEREVKTKIYSPKNAETVSLQFRGQKLAKAIGKLAEKVPNDGAFFTGLLVGKDYQYHILAPDDLATFTDLQTTVIKQRQYVPYQSGTWHLVRWHLELVFPGSVVDVNFPPPTLPDLLKQEEPLVKSEQDPLASPPPLSPSTAVVKRQHESVLVCGIVTVKNTGKRELIVEWDGNMVNDLIADSVLSVLLQIETSPTSVKMTTKSHSHDHGHGHDHPHELPKHEEQTERADAKMEDAAPQDAVKMEVDASSSDTADQKPLMDSTRPPPAKESRSEEAQAEFASRLVSVLQEQLSEVTLDDEQGEIRAQVDDRVVTIDLHSLTVACSYEPLKARVESVVRRLETVVFPSALSL